WTPTSALARWKKCCCVSTTGSSVDASLADLSTTPCSQCARRRRWPVHLGALARQRSSHCLHLDLCGSCGARSARPCRPAHSAKRLTTARHRAPWQPVHGNPRCSPAAGGLECGARSGAAPDTRDIVAHEQKERSACRAFGGHHGRKERPAQPTA